MLVNLAPRIGARRRALAAVAVALVAATCGTAAWAQGFEVKPWNVRTPAPALALADLDGRVWRAADLRGTALLINFWASWCEPCRAEMPSLQALAQRLGPDRLQVLTVNFKESPAVAARFAQRTGLTLPVVADPQGAVARAWGITVFPSTVFIQSDGRVQGVLRGELDWSGPEAEKLVASLLASKPQSPRR